MKINTKVTSLLIIVLSIVLFSCDSIQNPSNPKRKPMLRGSVWEGTGKIASDSNGERDITITFMTGGPSDLAREKNAEVNQDEPTSKEKSGLEEGIFYMTYQLSDTEELMGVYRYENNVLILTFYELKFYFNRTELEKGRDRIFVVKEHSKSKLHVVNTKKDEMIQELILHPHNS